jgi:predicted protein tyrosine phosphatase
MMTNFGHKDMWIQNAAWQDIKTGNHRSPGDNSMWISIVDPCMEHATPVHAFSEIHQFEFLDIEEKDFSMDESFRCSPEQAARIVNLLLHAQENQMNVVVSCVAGVCRSGAVTEVGVMLGFEDTNRFRCPNLLVKKLMMQNLGMTYE